ncbi:hypothetical protein DERF_008257 [Dermatophagoides farinae]|uniref:Uncharacterized protein n=1 Tax=Dermatophagoides farinae TaxID=6954 RepID=A0A922I315_DERFA|nr:hypothetical protein DERF_008257 [Dermatophagoides farinae]
MKYSINTQSMTSTQYNTITFEITEPDGFFLNNPYNMANKLFSGDTFIHKQHHHNHSSEKALI